ncbi:MAG: hypothetical protein ACLSCX_02880 [Oscillospiraceae bacterium]
MGKQLWQRPVFFDRNRVYRVYLGGKLFHDFLGDAPEDGFYPEEWVASTVHAMNAVSKGPFEGISMIEGTDLPFTKLLKSTEDCLGSRKTLGVLVKYLDSAIRLPMQVHPTRIFQRILSQPLRQSRVLGRACHAPGRLPLLWLLARGHAGRI